jgi:hypothetical protein
MAAVTATARQANNALPHRSPRAPSKYGIHTKDIDARDRHVLICVEESPADLLEGQ